MLSAGANLFLDQVSFFYTFYLKKLQNKYKKKD